MQADLFAPDWREALAALADLNLLRDLDRAVARFLHQQQPDAGAPALLLAALTSAQLAAGHLCLDFDEPNLAQRLWPDGAPAAVTTVLPGEPTGWPALLHGDPLIRDDGGTPLVLEGSRLYLRRHWAQEVAVAARIRARLNMEDSDAAMLRAPLSALFGPPEPGETDWQRIACALAARAGLTLITGGPGTGKTTTVVRLLGLLQTLALNQGRRLRIRLAAPTGKAAARLTASIGAQVTGLAVSDAVRASIPTDVSTLHRLLGTRPGSRHFRHHRHNPLHADLVVVDEASMIDMDMMASLLEALEPRTRLILLGDKDQLASVEAGAVLGDLCREAGPGHYNDTTRAYLLDACGSAPDATAPGTALAQQTALLRRNWRFRDAPGIGALAAAVNDGDPAAVAATFQASHPGLVRQDLRGQTGQLERLLTEGGAGQPGLRTLFEAVAQDPADGDRDRWAAALLRHLTGQQLLSGLRGGPFGVETLNRQLTEHLRRQGLAGEHEWYAGRPVMMTHNDYQLGLMNGDVGLTLPHPHGLRVAFQLADGRVRWVPPSRLGGIETVYVMTVHKSQGSEFNHTLLVLPEYPHPLLTRELVYTAVTRARRAFTLLEYGPPAVLAQAVRRRTWRASGLWERLGDG
jgi:exodeoxyribonuclease V alpha subunit